jgi:hypothetical protein
MYHGHGVGDIAFGVYPVFQLLNVYLFIKSIQQGDFQAEKLDDQ